MNRLLQSILILFLAFASFPSAQAQLMRSKELIELSYSNPQIFKIASITVEGGEYLDPATIISLSGLQIGDEIGIPGNQISNAIKNIWEQKLVGDVKIMVRKVVGYEVHLVILLKERARLSSIIMEGAKKGEKTDLEEHFGFITGQVISDPLIKNTTIAVKKYYKEKGFYNVKVDVNKIKDVTNENHVILKINVDKGEKVKIKPISITGNEVLTDKEVKKKLRNTKEKKGTRIFKRSKYIKGDFKDDKKALITYYNSLGYRDAKVESDSIYNIDDKLIGINLEVYEGQRYYFRDITWIGNNIYPDEQLDAILDIDKGDVYNQALLDTKLNYNPQGPDVSSLYLDDGYLFFSVKPVEVRVDGDSIDLEMRIYEGQQATINKITIDGNTKTNDHVILREIRTLPGEKFSRADIIRTQREIAQLGYFDPEQIGIIPVPNPQDGTVDIHYTVTEKPSDQLQLSGGWGGAAGFVGTVGLAFNNFSIRNIGNLKNWDPLPSGDGQRLNLRVQANGRQYQSYSISFTEPWLGGKKPVALSVSLSHTNQQTFSGSTFNDDFDGHIKVNAIQVSLGKRLTWPDDYFTLTHSVGLMNYDVNNYQRGTFACTTCDANNLSYGITVARNNVGTNPQFPTRGANISLSAKFTPPYSLIDKSIEEREGTDKFDLLEYHKWMFDNSWFLKLTGNNRKSFDTDNKKTERPFVLNLRAHFGYLGAYNQNVGVGPFERFQLGGDGLSGAGASYFLGTDVIGLRGYDNGIITGEDGNDGVFYDKFVAELRFPIVTQGIATIYVLGFMEGGNNWSNMDNVNPLKMYRSGGFGARIFMPAFGMLGVDWGYGFDEVPGKQAAGSSQVHFVIGQQLR